MNKVVRVFLDVNMCSQHTGLAAVAAEEKVNLNTLS